MFNVLVFGMTENPGGVESFLMNYYRRIDRTRFHFDFLCNSYDPVAFEDEIHAMGGRTIHFTSRRRNPLRFRRELESFFVRHAHEYQAIWVNVNSLANIDYLKMAKKYGIPKRIIHSHNAQNMDSRLRGMLGSIAEKGGSHKVTFTAGIGALIGLGFSAAAVAGIRAGARVKIEADVSCEGADRPLEVTFRLGGGLEAKLLAKAGLFSGPSASAGAGAQVSHFVTRSYASLDDLILDANRNKMATARSIGGAISGTVKTVGSKLGRLGTKLFRAIGRHSGDIMQSVRGYLDSLKGSGIIHKLDSLLTPRANPIIVAERDGYTGAVYGDLSGNIELASLVSMGGEVTVQHQHDFNVSSHTYAPIAQNIRNAGKPALAAMIRPLYTVPESLRTVSRHWCSVTSLHRGTEPITWPKPHRMIIA